MKSTESCKNVPIADVLQVIERILVVAAFPEPLGVKLARVREVLFCQRKGPGISGKFFGSFAFSKRHMFDIPMRPPSIIS